MRSRSKIIIVVTFLLVSGWRPTISAQKILSLEEAIATALQNNYDIQLARNDSAVAALDYEYRNAVFFPRVNGAAGTTWNNNSQRQEFSTGLVREGNVATHNINASLNLDWTLFDGLRMFATRQKAEEFIRLGELEIKNQVINTVADVINTYYNIVRQKQQLRAVEEQMSISETRVNLSQRKLDIGVGAKPEVLQGQVDLNAQKAAQLKQQTLIRQLKEILNHLLFPFLPGNEGPIAVDYDVIDTIPINAFITLDEIQMSLEANNPLLEIAEKNIDIANLTVKEYKADRYPIVEFNSAYNYNRTINNVTLNPALPISNRNNGLVYGFTAAVPILNYRNTQRLIRQAELNVGFQRLMYDNQHSLLRLDVINAYQDYELQKQALALEEDNIELAKENVSIILETYR
ncbi:MAG: TolC family protein, partial [Bacteroidota bacterium]|nr:TolC family protein [Bacteroidota bacterium]